MDYNKVIQQILQDYKKTFNIDINIVCDTRDKLQTIEPTLVIRGNTAAVYHNRSRTIFINSEVFEKVKNKNYNNSNNQYCYCSKAANRVKQYFKYFIKLHCFIIIIKFTFYILRFYTFHIFT